MKQYFLGFHRNHREIYIRRKSLAERLKMSVRTLDRYLHYLASTGWMGTVKRTPRTAIRQVRMAAIGGSVGESVGGSQEKEILGRKNQKQHHQPDDAAQSCLNSDGSADELNLLALAGVPVNEVNLTFIRAKVAAGISIVQMRGAVAMTLRRRLQAGRRGPIQSLKYFSGAIYEIVQHFDVMMNGADYCRFHEVRLQTEIQRQQERDAA